MYFICVRLQMYISAFISLGDFLTPESLPEFKGPMREAPGSQDNRF